MGFLDDVVGKVTGATGGGMEGQLMKAVTGMLGSRQGGGLGGIVENFTKNGLGDIISSWVGTGKNLPISADQIAKGLGADKINQLASSTGLPVDQISSMLAQILPGLVDKITPEGKLPSGDLLQKGLSMLLGK